MNVRTNPLGYGTLKGDASPMQIPKPPKPSKEK